MGSTSSKFKKYLTNGDEFAAMQVFNPFSSVLCHNVSTSRKLFCLFLILGAVVHAAALVSNKGQRTLIFVEAFESLDIFCLWSVVCLFLSFFFWQTNRIPMKIWKIKGRE